MEATIRDLRLHTAEVLAAADRGERVTITSRGRGSGSGLSFAHFPPVGGFVMGNGGQTTISHPCVFFPLCS